MESEDEAGGSAQIDDHVRVDVSFNTVVAALNHLLPDITVTHPCAKTSPLLRPERRLALVRLQGGNGVEDGDIQGPDFDPRVSRGLGYWGRLRDAVCGCRVRRWWSDQWHNCGESFRQPSGEEQRG